MGRYLFLEEVALADCALDLEARELHDLFETSASALAEVMVDPATVEPAVERILILKAPRLDFLLHDWLSELIYRKRRDREVFTRAKVWMSGRRRIA